MNDGLRSLLQDYVDVWQRWQASHEPVAADVERLYGVINRREDFFEACGEIGVLFPLSWHDGADVLFDFANHHATNEPLKTLKAVKSRYLWTRATIEKVLSELGSDYENYRVSYSFVNAHKNRHRGEFTDSYVFEGFTPYSSELAHSLYRPGKTLVCLYHPKDIYNHRLQLPYWIDKPTENARVT